MKRIRLNRLYAAIFACSMLWAGCSTDDEHPEPSYADLDWYGVEYDPEADELDQLRYTLYTEEGLSFFYNDTLAETIKYDAFTGEPYTDYHKYLIGYNFVNTTSSVRYTLSNQREAMKDFIEAYYAEVYPKLKDTEVSATRYFIVDSLYQIVSSSRKTVLDFYIDTPNKVIIMGMQSASTREWFNDMTEEARQEHMDTLYYKQVYNYYTVTNKVGGSDDYFQPFFDYSENAMPALTAQLSNNSIYGKGIYFTLVDPATGEPFLTPESRPEELGFLLWRSQSSSMISTPMGSGTTYANSDFDTYLKYTYLMTEEEFRTKYADWDIVLAKYDFLVEDLRSRGFDAFIGYGADKYDAVLE